MFIRYLDSVSSKWTLRPRSLGELHSVARGQLTGRLHERVQRSIHNHPMAGRTGWLQVQSKRLFYGYCGKNLL